MLIVLGLAAALTVSDPDGVVTTAPADGGAVVVDAALPIVAASPAPQTITPHNLTTQQQIDRWLATRPAAEPFAEAEEAEDRRVRGYVTGAIGSDDFSAVGVGVSIPLGERGRVDLSFQQVRNGYGLYGYGPRSLGPYGYGYGYGRGVDYAYGPFFGVEENRWSTAGAAFDPEGRGSPNFDLGVKAERPFGLNDPLSPPRPDSDLP